MKNNDYMDALSEVREVILPFLWFEELGELDDKGIQVGGWVDKVQHWT